MAFLGTMMSIAALVRGCNGMRRGAYVRAQQQQPPRLWELLEDSERAWSTIFGPDGERGEYMDGYSEQAMLDRCAEDYQWPSKFSPELFASERAKMMSHLYDNAQLWEYVSMVGFAEHYVLGLSCDEDIAKPFDTFRRQQESQPVQQPIFGGVVLRGWQGDNDSMDAVAHRIAALKEEGIEYIRLECNLGSALEIGGAAQLADNIHCSARLSRLAEVARSCQGQEMVPLILLQCPWREPGEEESSAYFRCAVGAFAAAARTAQLETKRVLFETRPPLPLSAQEETRLSATTRRSLGLRTGHEMFEVIRAAFGEEAIPGFCVAGGSTKGELPPAMEDDTQNAVRQGIRQRARKHWGYEVCFWEMGAKLMLQPKVGRLWGHTQAERDAARELFRLNAKGMADEIMAPLP